jgi:hypothetical protein
MEGLAAAFFSAAPLMFLVLSTKSVFEGAEVTELGRFGLLLELAWEMAALLLCFCSNMSSSSA